VNLVSLRLPKKEALVLEPVLLVTPPSVFLLDERVFVSLGILKVAAVLEKAGHRVEMLDLSGIENYLDVLEIQSRASAAKVIGITTTTPQIPAAVKLAERIRTARPDVRIILGGPHVTLVCAAVKLERKASRIGRAHKALLHLETIFDVLVAGDGELAIFDALNPKAPKVIDGDDPKTDRFMTSAVYEESPFPARHLVDMDSYHYSIDGKRASSLVAQLGCPFGCHFCGGRNSSSLRRIRTRTTASVLRELEEGYRIYGIEGWMFYDDELDVNPNMIELMNGIADLGKRLGVEWRLRGFVKAELFNDGQAESMYRAGFRWLLCGFEAADPRILVNINKRATVEDNARVIDIGHRHGLKVKALMSVGHAGENEASIRAVRDWLIESKPDDFDCTVITTYPGSPYYDEAVPHESMSDVWTYTCKKTKDRLHSYDVDYTAVADYYKGDPSGGYHAYVFTDHLSGPQIVKPRDWVEADVRDKLAIPFNPGAPAKRYEHSMGMGALPSHILRWTQ
jgi:anaerobic magnesium-protoporphyrin IX monomethyl ester cyclase